MRCVIIDDEPLAVEMLVNYVSRTPSLELSGSYTDPVLALSEMDSIKPDIVFLDIQMPDINGLELSKMLPEQTMIVFTTAFKEYAFESYEVEAVDYLLKPIRYQKFLEAVAKVEKRLNSVRPAFDADSSDRKTAFIKVNGEYKRIDFEDILCVSGMKDYVLIYLASEKEPLVTHITMKVMEDLLPPDLFMRVHRSHIVSLRSISHVDAYGDIWISGMSIPVSDTYRKRFESYMRENLLMER